MKTAIEWLFENVHIIPKFKLSVQDTIDKAKQMEKEQMLKSSISGSKGNSFEEYYNQTYNNKQHDTTTK